MTEQSPEQVEIIELSDEDQADLDQLYKEPTVPNFHTVLEVWREVLKPAAAEAEKRPTPSWCNKIIASYQGITYKEMYTFRDLYFARLEQLRQILLTEIATDPDCLSYDKPEVDAEENAKHYRNLLRDWQLTVLQWELDWDCTNHNAAVDLGTLSEVHKIFFADGTGLIAFLENIKFEFTEADQAELLAALEALRDGEVNSE